MINPDLHITIYISEEVVKLFCGTVAFIVTVWGTTKMATILKGKQHKEDIQC